MRTSKSVVFLRSCVVIFMIYLPISLVWNSITGTNFWKWWEMAVSAVLSVLLYGGFAWVFANVGMALIYGRKPEYRAYRNSGGDPFFDSLPRVFNPDFRSVRETGMAEPRTNFVPPASWKYQCPQCGARVQHCVDVCWNCSYGADGDSTAYFDRYGDVKPPEFTDADWAEIRRRHDV